MREFINILVERQLDGLTNDIVEKATDQAYGLMDWSSGDVGQLEWEYCNEFDQEDVDTDSDEFRTWVRGHLEGRVHDAYYTIENLIENDTIVLWRVITANADWTPAGRHPGIYWSWDKNAAEAHWGSFGGSQRKFRMEAIVPLSSVDWIATLAHNASMSYQSEREIRLFPDADLEITNVEHIG